MSDYPCPQQCGHTHYGRCLLWRCHCPGAPIRRLTVLEPPRATVHGQLLFVDIEGRPFAECECGWVSGLASDAENAEGMWDHHISTLDDNE